MIIRKILFLRIIKRFRIKLTKNQLLQFNSNVLSPAAKRELGLIEFSVPKRRFGRNDSADCSEAPKALIESYRSTTQGNPVAVGI